MDDVERGEVAEGGCSQNAVAEVQRADVQHAQVQQLPHTGQRSDLLCSLPVRACVRVCVCLYLRDLDVQFLRELRNQEVLLVRLGFHLSVQLQPADGRLGTEAPVQRLGGRSRHKDPRQRRETGTTSKTPESHLMEVIMLRRRDGRMSGPQTWNSFLR